MRFTIKIFKFAPKIFFPSGEFSPTGDHRVSTTRSTRDLTHKILIFIFILALFGPFRPGHGASDRKNLGGPPAPGPPGPARTPVWGGLARVGERHGGPPPPTPPPHHPQPPAHPRGGVHPGGPLGPRAPGGRGADPYRGKMKIF